MDGSDPLMGLKRKCSSLSQTKNYKRVRLDESRINIVQLSDCTLLNVLQFLDSTSLYQLGQTCLRFNQLVRDESLWVYVDARHKPNNINKLDYCWDNVHKKTKTILTAGESRSEVVLSLEKLVFNSNLENLTVLALENQCIKYCKLNDFPPTLQELSFRKSYISQQDTFFRFSHETMWNLRVLLLDHCQWLSPNCFVSLSRFPNLEILSFYMCKKLGNDDMSSISVSASCGFPSIKVFDLRFTDIGDAFIRSFYKSKTLQVVYMQNYARTYYKERKQRMEGVGRGQKFKEHSYVSDDEDNDLSGKSIERRFGSAILQKYQSNSISDHTLSVFQNVKGCGGALSRPKSNLYVYPYHECTCGFSRKQMLTFEELEDEKSEVSEVSSDEEPTFDPKSTNRGLYYLVPDDSDVCNRITFDSCLGPEWCHEQSTPECFKHRWLFAREPRNDHEIAMLEHTDKHFRARIAIRTYRNANELCREPTCICSLHQNQLLIFTSDDGRSPVRPEYRPIIPSMIKEVSDRSILILIEKIANIVERIKTSIHPDSEVLYILKQIFDSLKLELDSAYYNDSTFICRLRVALTELVKNVRHKILYVLRHHFDCFELLLNQLQYNDTLLARKQTLTTFFNNLMRSEVNPYSNECKNKDEKWNIPGTSGRNAPASDHLDRSIHNNPVKTTRKKYVDSGNTGGFIDSMTMYVIRRNVSENVDNLEDPRVRNNLRNLIIRFKRNVCTSEIKELSLRGYQDVTNDSLLYLKDLDLELLDVTGTNVTLSGVRKFMLSNPLCRVLHKFACVCKPSLHF